MRLLRTKLFLVFLIFLVLTPFTTSLICRVGDVNNTYITTGVGFWPVNTTVFVNNSGTLTIVSEWFDSLNVSGAADGFDPNTQWTINDTVFDNNTGTLTLDTSFVNSLNDSYTIAEMDDIVSGISNDTDTSHPNTNWPINLTEFMNETGTGKLHLNRTFLDSIYVDDTNDGFDPNTVWSINTTVLVNNTGTLTLETGWVNTINRTDYTEILNTFANWSDDKSDYYTSAIIDDIVGGISNDSDTNETTRFDTLVGTDCTGTDKVVGIDADGTVSCDTDDTDVADLSSYINTTRLDNGSIIRAGNNETWVADNHGLNNDSFDLANISTNYNVEIDGINITLTSGFWGGQPLDGGLGSGIIWSDYIDEQGLLNVSVVSGLTIAYPNFTVRLARTDNTIKYCNITFDDGVIVPDDQHTVFYVDNSCVVKNATMAAYIATDLSPGGITDFFNVMSHDGAIDVVKGTTVMNKGEIQTRKKILSVDHLKIVSGLNVVTDTFPSYTQRSGTYLYIRTVVESTAQNVSTDDVRFMYHTGGEWDSKVIQGINLTHCDDGDDLAPCSDNRYRRYLMYSTGHDAGTTAHLLAAEDATTYLTVAECLNTEAHPISYTLPSYADYTAVVHHIYCGRRDDLVWTTNFLDLRVGTFGFGAVPDLSIFLTDDDIPSDYNNSIGRANLTAIHIVTTNMTTRTDAVNTSGNIAGLGFYTSSAIDGIIGGVSNDTNTQWTINTTVFNNNTGTLTINTTWFETLNGTADGFDPNTHWLLNLTEFVNETGTGSLHLNRTFFDALYLDNTNDGYDPNTHWAYNTTNFYNNSGTLTMVTSWIESMNDTYTKAQIDDIIGGVSNETDTNETTRFDTLVGTDCEANDFVTGVDADGTVACDTPTGGAAAGDKWVDNGTYISPNSTFADNVIIQGNLTVNNNITAQKIVIGSIDVLSIIDALGKNISNANQSAIYIVTTNMTGRIDAVNTSTNIVGLGFYTSSEIDDIVGGISNDTDTNTNWPINLTEFMNETGTGKLHLNRTYLDSIYIDNTNDGFDPNTQWGINDTVFDNNTGTLTLDTNFLAGINDTYNTAEIDDIVGGISNDTDTSHPNTNWPINLTEFMNETGTGKLHLNRTFFDALYLDGGSDGFDPNTNWAYNTTNFYNNSGTLAINTGWFESIGNWSADKGDYYTSAEVDAISGGLNNLSYTDILNSFGNWSTDKADYYTSAEIDDFNETWVALDLVCTDCISGTEISELADADVSDTLTCSDLVAGSEVVVDSEVSDQISVNTTASEVMDTAADVRRYFGSNMWILFNSTTGALAIG